MPFRYGSPSKLKCHRGNVFAYARLPVGFALAEAPALWESLSQKERENVEAWLGNSINEKKSVILLFTFA